MKSSIRSGMKRSQVRRGSILLAAMKTPTATRLTSNVIDVVVETESGTIGRGNASFEINDERVSNDKMTLDRGHLTPQGVIKLSLGRKRHVLLRPV